MSGQKKSKQELCLSAREAAEKLRALAEELERAVVSINEEEYSIVPDTQVMASLKAKGDTFSFKLKFKLKSTLSEKEGSTLSTEPDVENYKDLKKRMSIDFKTIKKRCIQEHVFPNSDLVERFYQDSKAMCTYPEKGEEFYETFLKQADYLYEAFKTSDMKAMNSAIKSLVQARTECHGKYK
ncbi:MAG: GAK system XXXCH domain-containing protein [Planctomycetes bacterium]|nr:GAK system XXXCH domain-containing protein [Planctomycetota bacterium]